MVNNEELQQLNAILRKLNQGAEIIPCEHGRVPLQKIINTGSFDFEEASQSAGWIK